VSEEKIMTSPKTFFSYSRTDAEFALKLAKDLREAGANVWLDQLDIPPGQHWDTEIEKALESAENMLVILSPKAIASNNVMDEISFALEEGKRVIPIILSECTIPFRIKRLQYVDFSKSYEAGMDLLLKALGLQQKEYNKSESNITATSKEQEGTSDEGYKEEIQTSKREMEKRDSDISEKTNQKLHTLSDFSSASEYSPKKPTRRKQLWFVGGLIGLLILIVIIINGSGNGSSSTITTDTTGGDYNNNSYGADTSTVAPADTATYTTDTNSVADTAQ